MKNNNKGQPWFGKLPGRPLTHVMKNARECLGGRFPDDWRDAEPTTMPESPRGLAQDCRTVLERAARNLTPTVGEV